jgi:MinD superfamily P-loop ATPase
MKIAVASGKGGTGKSLVAANLAFSLMGEKAVTLVDCDVEEPNLHLFFPGLPRSYPVKVPVPVFDEEKCTLCGECGKICRYGAITVLGDRILLFEDLCHACGGCRLICPEGAITEKPRIIGRIETKEPYPGLTLISGVLNEGEIQAPFVIRAAKKEAEGNPLIIYDASPGIGCPVIETLEGCDAAILVTEPTPFGLHDLLLAFEVTEMLGIPSGVVINRDGTDDDQVSGVCREHNIPVFMTIPFDREIARIQNSGELITRVQPEWKQEFRDLFGQMKGIAGVKP